MGLLDHKVALVTGAGRGIGRGVARRFALEGAAVVVAEFSREHGEAVVHEITSDLGGKAIFLETDVAVKGAAERAVASAVEAFGGLDILVNNACALTPNVLLEDKTDEMLADVLGVGLWGAWWMMRAALGPMRERGGGRIINFYSIDAETGAWLHADYNAAKGAIQGLTRTAAAEWGRYNILVNAIAPTAKGTVFAELCEAIPNFEATAAAHNPLGRVGDPEADIAPVVVFLASDLARYLTGETINVDGGQHLPRYNSRPPGLDPARAQ